MARPSSSSRSDPRGRVGVGARHDLVLAQVADGPQKVVQPVRAAHAPSLGEALQLELQLVQRARVQQLAQLLGAEQLAQQVAVEGERGRASLGQRRVALVHVDGDPAEEQRLRERRRALGVDRHELGRARPQVAHDLAQRRHVEDVAQAFARGLEQHRERGMLRGLGQQVGAALALLPQRRAPAGTLTGEQQGARAGLAEHAGEQRRARQRLHDLGLDVLRVEQQVFHRDAVHGLGEADDDAVVAPQHLRARAEPIEQPRLDGQAPRRVHALAERREDAHPPVADLVAEALDDHGPVVGYGAGGLQLVVEVGHEVLGGPVVQADVVAQALERLRRAASRAARA